MNLNEILKKVTNVKKQGKEYLCRCPAHADKTNSLSISEGTDKRILLHCHAGCDIEKIIEVMGLKTSDLFPDKVPEQSKKIVAVYSYIDLDGKLRHETVRFEPKGFTQRAPDGKGGYIYSLKGVETVLYNLQKVTEAISKGETVYIVEGEKDSDNMGSLKLVATTSAMGAGKWQDYYSNYLINAIVVIIPDNDDIGKSHGQQVARSLQGKAKSIKIIDLTKELLTLEPKGDITDFFKKLGKNTGMESLQRLVNETHEWNPLYNDEPQQEELQEVIEEEIVPYPANINEAAYHGIAGKYIKLIEPETESDPIALLILFLVFVGNYIGRTAYFMAEAQRHYLNLYIALVGDSSRGRKGTATAWARKAFQALEDDWLSKNIVSGLSSGEGLIYRVRDPAYKKEPITEGKGKDKKIIGEEDVCVDDGIEDKRLLVQEEELASALKCMQRKENTLSPVLRRAWDGGRLETLTKNSPTISTDAHISLIGHITGVELKKTLSEVEQANGLGNRFLWVCVRRSKLLPLGGNIDRFKLDLLGESLKDVLEYAIEHITLITLGNDAREAWVNDIYKMLSKDETGFAASMTARAEAQVLRIASIYAVLDKTNIISLEHLGAALAVWEYCENSVQFIFGGQSGNTTTDRILEAIQKKPMTQTEINDFFGGHISSNIMSESLKNLSSKNKISSQEIQTGGRPKTIWKSN